MDTVTTTTFEIPGAHCGRCRLAILDAFAILHAVQDADVDLRTRQATVTFDPGRSTREDIAAVLTVAGYPPLHGGPVRPEAGGKPRG